MGWLFLLGHFTDEKTKAQRVRQFASGPTLWACVLSRTSVSASYWRHSGSVGTPGHVWGRFGGITAEADAAGLQGVEAGCLSTPSKAQGSPHGPSDSAPSVNSARRRSQVSAPCS